MDLQSNAATLGGCSHCSVRRGRGRPRSASDINNSIPPNDMLDRRSPTMGNGQPGNRTKTAP